MYSSHGANPLNSCPFSPLAYFPLLPEEEFTIRASGAPYSVQMKPERALTFSDLHRRPRNDQPMIRCMYGVITRTKSVRKIAWKGRSSTIWRRYSTTVDSDGTAISNEVTQQGPEKRYSAKIDSKVDVLIQENLDVLSVMSQSLDKEWVDCKIVSAI